MTEAFLKALLYQCIGIVDHSQLGRFAITCVGKSNNADALIQECFEK